MEKDSRHTVVKSNFSSLQNYNKTQFDFTIVVCSIIGCLVFLARSCWLDHSFRSVPKNRDTRMCNTSIYQRTTDSLGCFERSDWENILRILSRDWLVAGWTAYLPLRPRFLQNGENKYFSLSLPDPFCHHNNAIITKKIEDVLSLFAWKFKIGIFVSVDEFCPAEF